MSNTLLTNSFTGGMNLDTDLTYIPADQYRYAENIRIVTDKDGTTGAILNIESVIDVVGGSFISSNEVILYALTVKEYAVIITVDDKGISRIYRVSGYTESVITNIIVMKGYLGFNKTSNLKVVANYESEANIKIYITDGLSSIKSVNIMDNKYVYVPGLSNPALDNEGNVKDPFAVDMTPSSVLNPPTLVDLGTGNLLSGSVLYSYLLFSTRGSNTVTSPCCNLIPLFAGKDFSEVNNVKGSNKEENSGKSVIINILLIDANSGINYNSFYDRCRVYRITYTDNSATPKIDVIDELNITANASSFTYEDTGSSAINTITIEEFNAANNNSFAAATIEKKDNILFAAGIKENTWDVEYDARSYRCTSSGKLTLKHSNSEFDVTVQLPTHLSDEEILILRGIDVEHDCINPYNLVKGVPTTDENCLYSNVVENGKRILGGSGLNVDYRFVVTDMLLDTLGGIATPVDGNQNEYAKIYNESVDVSSININKLEDGTTIEQFKFPTTGKRQLNYSNPYISYKFKSYLRDEIYRFGIIFYDDKGIATPVHWIADIRMPHPYDYCSFFADTKLLGKALGLLFNLRNLPAGVIAYDIVRCKRTALDRTILMQGVMSNITNYPYNLYNVGDQLANSRDYRPEIPLSYSSADKWYKRVAVLLGNISATHTLGFQGNKLTKDYNILISPELDISGESILENFKDTYVDFAYFLSNRVLPVNGFPKFFVTPEYTCKTLSSDRVRQGTAMGTAWGENIKGMVIAIDGMGIGDHSVFRGNEVSVTNLIGKHYIPHQEGVGQRTTIDLLNNAIYPPVLQQWDHQSASLFYKTIGNIAYYNVATNVNESGEYSWSAFKTGYFGRCAIINGSFGNAIPRVNRVSIATARCNDNIKNKIGNVNDSPYEIPIINIKKKGLIPYGGNSYIARVNSTYSSTDSYTIVSGQTSSSKVTYGGDTYLGILDHKTCSTMPRLNSNIEINSISVTDYIPFETSINLNLLFGLTTSKSCEGLMIFTDVYLANTPSAGTFAWYSLTKDYYAYNDAYSVSSDVKLYTLKGRYAMSNVNNINRIIYSSIKTNNELTDSWLIFKPADYLDVDSLYGPITNMKSFGDRLYFWQDTAVGVASVNDRSLISDNNVGSLVLGTGGILTRYDYVTTGNGSSISNDKSIVNSDSTIYWHDRDKNEVCALSDGVHKLSKEKNVLSYLNKNINNKVHDALYDAKFNEILMCFNDKVLVYNELVLKFSSFYTYNPDSHLRFSDLLLYLKNNKITKNLNYSLNLLLSNLLFVINKDPMNTKTFDNVYFSGLFDDINTMLKNVTFNTKTQKSLILSDYLDNSYAIDYREDTYRFAIGREEKADDEESLPGRMKGKYLLCNYTIDCSDNHNFTLPYINTTYRYSLV